MAGPHCRNTPSHNRWGRLSGFCKLDYLLRDHIVGDVAAINKPKRASGVRMLAASYHPAIDAPYLAKEAIAASPRLDGKRG